MADMWSCFFKQVLSDSKNSSSRLNSFILAKVLNSVFFVRLKQKCSWGL